MEKLLLVSILISTMVLPMRAARRPHPVHGLRRAILYTLIFNALYAFAILYIYPRIL
jgi:hypothetical protein